jgi:DNA excision repair protein ERCC-2
MKVKSKLVTVALRDFALPVPRTGSIEVYSGYGRAASEGQEIHVRAQKKRMRSDPSYEPEVSISHSFCRGPYLFQVDGRMDGIFRRDPPKIEEIKTSFNVREMAHRLVGNPLGHPYCLQLLTYGYFYWLNFNVLPELTLHLVSTRNREAQDLVCRLDLPAYERWLDRRLDELVAEARKAERRVLRRKKIAPDFTFPFEDPRPGQVEIVQTIQQGMERGFRLLIQAPTGLGKTIGVLYPVLKDALSRGQKVIYVTPKNSQHAVAEDAVLRFQEAGPKIKSLTITAKGKICFKNEPLCNPVFCEYARDYYAKVHENGVLDILAKKRKLTARTFRDLGEEHEVCPFELQFDASPEADIVICDYNYVFASRAAFGRITATTDGQEGKPSLIIDEAHNLPSRAMEYYSPSLSSLILESMRSATRSVPAPFHREAEELLDGCIQAIASCRRVDSLKPSRIDPPAELFFEQDARLRAFLSRYLDSGADIQPNDVIMRLCFSWSEFTETLGHIADPEREEFFATFHPHPSGGTVKITCCDASEMIKDCYDEYEHVIGFSATLKPFDYYAGLSGLDPDTVKTAEFPSPFLKENRKLLVIPQISTKYSERQRNYPRIADAIHRIAVLRKGNYFAFFPSFEFLDKVIGLFQPPHGFAVLRQERYMKRHHVEAALDHLRAGAKPTIVFAVQGGLFSEGMDYPGDMLIGAFVIGPPLPNFDLEREEMRKYYERRYGAGFAYAYSIPAMSKAIQAAGRVIRSETDRGLIVLMDSRFVQPCYSRSMPADWHECGIASLVSKGILKEVSDFWERNNAADF